MNKIFCFLALIFTVSFVYAQKDQRIAVIRYEELDEKIKNEKDKVVVVNFWSTTCAPCVKELPDFMEVNNQFKDRANFKMLLVSLDRIKDQEKVMKFIREKNINAEVVLLDDIKRMNTWIPYFHENWEGNIPVTIIYKNTNKVHFNDGEMTRNELENLVSKNL